MISHELKCIFIHIPRTAGSSIEKFLVGTDWWRFDRRTKHLVASQAKKIYKEYWDDYFKFSFVRNPYSRMLSMASYSSNMRRIYFGNETLLSDLISREFINGYRELFGQKILLEHDHRFYKRSEIITNKHKPGCVYGNILDENLDFVGRFETLADDMKFICDTLKVNKMRKLPIIGQGKHDKRLDIHAQHLINTIYKDDFTFYNYPLD